MSIQHGKIEGERRPMNTRHDLDVLPYSVDMSSFLILPHCIFDEAGVPYHESLAEYHPTTIAQFALSHWNQYLVTNDEQYRRVFLTQAYWFVEHEVPIGEDAGGWPISFTHPDSHRRGLCMSALAQGAAISLLVRAYQLTGKEMFLRVAHHAVRTFERDILDGGVSTPIGEHGLFFEETAVYPAAHTLSGFIFALFGLYDYVTLTSDAQIEKLVQHSLTTMHSLLAEFDLGFWTRSNLLNRCLASPSELALQIELLEVLAKHSGCDHCTKLALRWKSYRRQLHSRLRYMIISCCASYTRAFWSRAQTALFPQAQAFPLLRVLVPVPSFPMTGGIRTVLEGVAQVTANAWRIEYLTHHVGPRPEKFVIHQFGTKKMSPWHFPTVWLYVLAGCRKILSLMHQGAGYHVILPQDGLFTAAFSALAAKLAGVRVVCIDHSTLTWVGNRAFRAEYTGTLAKKHWHWTLRLLDRLLIVLYWPSLYLLARISALLVDHFLIPGVAGDGTEEICKRLRVPTSRITRYSSMVNVHRHVVSEAATRAGRREEKSIPADAIVVAIICRLAPEKGLHIAIESISRALALLPLELRARIRVVIAGDGPLRRQVAEDISMRGLSLNCVLWGDISTEEVLSLLAISDIFLYTSTRGGCFAMAVLEAMASSCAVIASTKPISNAFLLAEGRGVAVPPDNAAQTALALVRLVSNLELCRLMGNLARDFIATHHSPTEFRRTLMRATYWFGLDEILASGRKLEIIETGSES